MTETCRGIPAGLATRIGRYAPYALQKTIHTDVEVDATKKAFFDVFESDASARRVSYDCWILTWFSTILTDRPTR